MYCVHVPFPYRYLYTGFFNTRFQVRSTMSGRERRKLTSVKYYRASRRVVVILDPFQTVYSAQTQRGGICPAARSIVLDP